MQRLRAAIGSDLLVLSSVTGIVYDEQNRILLVKQSDVGLWSTPGGSIDPLETPADAVVREVWEETGLYVAPTKLLGVYGGPMCSVTYPNGDQVTYITNVFECEVRAGSLSTTSDETVDATFVGASEFDEYDTTLWARHVVPHLYTRTAQGYFDAPTWRPR